MSVREVSAEELQGLYKRCVSEPGLLRERTWVTGKELARALRGVHAANKAALYFTYGESVTIPAFEVADVQPAELSLRELFEQLGNVVYNCISNCGRCFLPREHQSAITGVRLGVARLALARARESDKEVRRCRELRA